MRKIIVAILLSIGTLVACSTPNQAGTNTPPPPQTEINVEGAYSGTMTATYGGEGSVPLTVTLTAGAVSGYAAQFTTADGTAQLICGDVKGGTLSCIAMEGLDFLTFEGPITATKWSGDFNLKEYRAGDNITLAGTFHLEKQ